MASLLLPEFDHEMASTRKVLARVPADRADWKPHPKSYSLGHLAVHLATVTSWTAPTLTQAAFDLKGAPPPAPMSSVEELLARFDRHVAEARAAIAAAPDDAYGEAWSLTMGEQVYFTMPKGVVLRQFVLNHNVHHRAQLGVYLRLLDIPVPNTYGPTADES